MGFAGDLLQMNRGQIFQSTQLPSENFAGKTIVVTGANTGLGLEAAKHIFSLKAAHLILACRNAEKGETARREILATSNSSSSSQKVEVWQVDLSSYKSVLAFADRLKGLSRLDVLLANAGIVVDRWRVFEGNESTITVNVISTMLLAMLAIPKLRETSAAQGSPSHLVVTGTSIHILANHKDISGLPRGQIFKSLGDKSRADMKGRYTLSKLVLLFCVRKLAAALGDPLEKSSGVLLTYVNPGWCKTELFRNDDGGVGGRIGLALIGRTAEQGSRTLVSAATADATAHGKYLSECRVKPESSFARSEAGLALQEEVWVELMDILEGIAPGVSKLR